MASDTLEKGSPKTPPSSLLNVSKDSAKANKSNETSENDEEEQADKSNQDEAKESTPKKRGKTVRFDVDLSDSDNEFDSESVQSDVPAPPPRKTTSTVGKNLFASVVKDIDISIIGSDDDDEDGSAGEGGAEEKKRITIKKKESADANSSGNSVEILDTSMFKESKKDYNPKQLSRILQTNRNKHPTTRVSPECISLSSDDDIEIEPNAAEKKDDNDDDEEEKEKRVTRKLLRPDQLADDTKHAQKEEQERIKRLDKKNDRLSQFIESQRASQEESEEATDPNEVVLDIDSKKNEKIVVHPEITKHLKPHQVEGVKFMYDCCYGSVDNLAKHPGSGCILAHCMGLGKTLQLISLLHTVICYKQLKTDKVLVVSRYIF